MRPRRAWPIRHHVASRALGGLESLMTSAQNTLPLFDDELNVLSDPTLWAALDIIELGCGAARRVRHQAKVSAISALNQMFICSKPSEFQPADAPLELATAIIARVPGSYWNTAVSHDACCIVIVE